jgi:hypothetical protein
MDILGMVRKAVRGIFPELGAGLHLPRLGIVTEIPDPPAEGGQHTHRRPRYAVNLRILLPDGETVDPDMPVLEDVPVAMAAAGPGRGFAGLPAVGTVVEVAFAYARITQPFVRSVLPYRLTLPAIDADSQRWQQSASSFQEVDADGNWTMRGGKIWIGNGGINLLANVTDYQQSVDDALQTIATHTHNGSPPPDQAATIAAKAAEVNAERTALLTITKE